MGRVVAPLGPLTLQVKLTDPVNPFPGTMVTVAAPVAPGASMSVALFPTREIPGDALDMMLCILDISSAFDTPLHDAFKIP